MGKEEIMFTLTINTDNTAFRDEEDDAFTPALELNSILEHVRTVIMLGATEGTCRDSNGNNVGSWKIES